MRYRGLVVKKPFGVGSKSEHDAVKLVTDSREYVLRRQDGNPFSDPVLDALVGQTIECDGIVHGYTLIMSSWRQT
jgi:hypothetical protein